ncbi:hypothetical protein PTNB73_10300 [Pyrenophora teres f. teres]|nr:hypothetical protein PTNB73_10300 [Pyrenophora teres f. teres]
MGNSSHTPYLVTALKSSGGKVSIYHEQHLAIDEDRTSPIIDKITIVEMSGRGPESENLEEFWDIIMSKQDICTEVPPDRFNVDDYYCLEHGKTDKKCTITTKYGCFMNKPGHSDACYCRVDFVGAVVLKRLEDAVAHNDNILGVIAASGRNHSGNSTSISTSDAGAQERLFRRILRDAGVGPDHVGYVEMHGTGTPVGDPAEVGAVGNIFRHRRPESTTLPVGSIKANIGHSEAAAGMSSLLKCITMFQRDIILPQADMPHAPNPRFPPLVELNIDIPSGPRSFPRSSDPVRNPRRNLLNNNDAAGSNASILLEDFSQQDRPRAATDARPTHVFATSARTQVSLQAHKRKLIKWLRANPQSMVQDIAYTTTARRMHHPFRFACTASTIHGLIAKLETDISGESASLKESPPLVFVFTGQGSHYAGMGGDLYRTSPAFRNRINLCHYAAQHPVHSRVSSIWQLLIVYFEMSGHGIQPGDIRRLAGISLTICEEPSNEPVEIAPGPSASAAQQMYLTCLQYVVEESVSPEKIRVTMCASLSEPGLRALIEGHQMVGQPIASGSIFCEAAFVATTYALRSNGRGEDAEKAKLAILNLIMSRPLNKNLVDAEGQLLATVVMEGSDSDEVQISWRAAPSSKTTRQTLYNISTCMIQVCRNVDGLQASWTEYPTLSKQGWTRSPGQPKTMEGTDFNLIFSTLFFAKAVQYESHFKCFRQAFVNSSFTESAAEIVLNNDPAGTSFVLSPYWGEAIAHLAGFTVNANPENFPGAAKTSWINSGFESFKYATTLEAEISYFVYVRVTPLDLNEKSCDVFIFDLKDRLVSQILGCCFREIGNDILGRSLGPKTKSTVGPQEASQTPNNTSHQQVRLR